MSLKLDSLKFEILPTANPTSDKDRAAKLEKVPYFIVIGDQEVSDGTGTLESRDNGKVGAFKIAEIVDKLSAEIKSRT